MNGNLSAFLLVAAVEQHLEAGPVFRKQLPVFALSTLRKRCRLFYGCLPGKLVTTRGGKVMNLNKQYAALASGFRKAKPYDIDMTF